MKTRILRVLSSGGLLPPVFISTIAMAMAFGTIPNLVSQKLCSPLVQPDINGFICEDAELVGDATSLTSTSSTIRSVTTAVSVALFGAWRDSTGRNRPLLIIGELTQAVCALIFLVAAWSWSSSPWLPVILESVLGGALGMGIRGLASSCIIVENSKPEERTTKFQLFTTAAFLAALVSSLLRGFLLTSLGYVWLFGIVCALHLLATLMFMAAVKDTKREVVQKKKMDTLTKLKTAFQSRPNGAVVWLMTVCKPLVNAYFSAEHMIGMYFMQQGFQFTVNEGTIYGTYHLLIVIVGSFAMPLLFTKVLKWSDFKIGIASSSLTAVSALATAFAKTKTELYLIAVLDILKYLLYSIPQSVLSKCISNNELGLFSGFSSSLGVFLPFGVNYMYKSTFAATSKTMPGAIYLISATGNVIVAILFCLSAYLYTAPEKEKSEKNGKESLIPEDKKEQEAKKVD